MRSPGLRGSLRHLVRPAFDLKTAVDRLDLRIERGESVAYVGANGAGKSTTIKMLTGILVPTSGDVRVMGLVPHRQRRQNAYNIGVIFGQRTQLWWDLPVGESFAVLRDMYEVPPARFSRLLDGFCDFLEIGPLLQTPVRQLSLGQRMRCDLAAALLHSPPVLFLDEPTIGLDVVARTRIRDFIKRANRQQETTLIITSHDLDDLEDLCGRLVLLHRSSIVFDGPLTAFKRRYGRERVLHVILRRPDASAADRVRSVLPASVATRIEQPEPGRVTVQFDQTSTTAAAIVTPVLRLFESADIQIQEPSIEAIVRDVFDGTLQVSD